MIRLKSKTKFFSPLARGHFGLAEIMGGIFYLSTPDNSGMRSTRVFANLKRNVGKLIYDRKSCMMSSLCELVRCLFMSINGHQPCSMELRFQRN